MFLVIINQYTNSIREMLEKVCNIDLMASGMNDMRKEGSAVT